ncbi:MAG: hypothetical protein K6A67_06165 [Bacteroidales bacterium]|nr:hypothetical protein [Bacteroidales bacterium]
MTFETFYDGCCELLGNYYQSFDEEYRIGLKAYCQSVFDECCNTMPDDELAKMMDIYGSALLCGEDEREELNRLNDVQIRVYRNLAHGDFARYGRLWADAIHRSIFYSSDDLAMPILEKCIELYIELGRMGQDCGYSLAWCYELASSKCGDKEDYIMQLEYLSRAFEVYRRKTLEGDSCYFNFGVLFYYYGCTYNNMGRNDFAIKSFEKSIEYYTRDAQENNWIDCEEHYLAIKESREMLEKLEG